MTTFLQFAVLGLGVGASYALLAQGLVVVHRGSGVVNFAHGGLAVLAAFVFVELTADNGWPPLAALIVTVIGVAGLGALIYFLAIRPLRDASTVARVIATLAILIIIESVATLRWGVNPRIAPSLFTKEVLEVGEVSVPVNRLILASIAVGLTIALWAAFRFTLPGIATSALAENRRAAGALGWSPDALAAGTWALGAGLAALAGILIAPLSGVSPDAMTTLLIVGLAAALLGKLTSFPLVLVGSIGIGIAQSEAGQYIDRQGVAESIPFFVIVAVLVLQGRRLAPPSATVERFAEIGSGLVRPKLVLPVLAIFAVLLLALFSPGLQSAVGATLAFAIVMLSVVVLTGYAGQLSLAQAAFGGVGALVAGKLVGAQGWPLEVAALAGVVVAVPVGLLFAVPALRVRGVTLAIVTLGLGLALTKIVFEYGPITGGSDGTPVGPQTLFGIDIDASAHPGRYALLVTILFALCALSVANLRRSRAGRRLIAVRANERAAAALGISVYGAKLYAFGLAAGIAAVGGIAMGFQYQTILYDIYAPFQSVIAVGLTALGGLGYIAGPLLASPLIVGGVGQYILEDLFSGIDKYLELIGGIGLLLLILQDPNGLAASNLKTGRALIARLHGPREPRAEAAAGRPAEPIALEPVPPLDLEVTDLTVRFGGVVALDSVSMSVHPGKITGLIGPNGAGKTTLINAVTGFVDPAKGAVALGSEPISAWPPHRRARAGISRSFQSLELFEDMTVTENLRVAADSRDMRGYFTGIVAADHSPLPPVARWVIREFELEDCLDKRPNELPYGQRRLVAIARAVAVGASILMLDEPAAGLDDAETRELAALIRRLADEWHLGVLLIEHNVSLVMDVCDTVTVLDFGRQIAAGPPEQVRTDPAVIAAYLGEEHAAEHERGTRVAPSGPTVTTDGGRT